VDHADCAVHENVDVGSRIRDGSLILILYQIQILAMILVPILAMESAYSQRCGHEVLGIDPVLEKKQQELAGNEQRHSSRGRKAVVESHDSSFHPADSDSDTGSDTAAAAAVDCADHPDVPYS
jgi:hypothetical protein